MPETQQCAKLTSHFYVSWCSKPTKLSSLAWPNCCLLPVAYKVCSMLNVEQVRWHMALEHHFPSSFGPGNSLNLWLPWFHPPLSFFHLPHTGSQQSVVSRDGPTSETVSYDPSHLVTHTDIIQNSNTNSIETDMLLSSLARNLSECNAASATPVMRVVWSTYDMAHCDWSIHFEK